MPMKSPILMCVMGQSARKAGITAVPRQNDCDLSKASLATGVALHFLVALRPNTVCSLILGQHELLPLLPPYEI